MEMGRERQTWTDRQIDFDKERIAEKVKGREVCDSE